MRSARQVGLGIVGMGFMGLTHLLAAQKLRGAQVRAIVTADPRKARGDFRGVRGNFGAGGSKVDLGGVRVHAEVAGLLADPAVDLVDICLPSYLHAEVAMRALGAGKHVLVEKPMALAVAETRLMLDAARRARKLLLVGQVLKFFPEFALLGEARADGRWGELLALHLRRRIAQPSWGAESWFADEKKSGGMVVDLHIHDTDFVLHLQGQPRAVTSHGLLRNGRIDFIRTAYHWGRSAPLITAEAGWINAPALPFTHGYDAFFERATISYDSHRAPEPLLFAGKGSRPLRLKAPEAFQAELQAAADSVRSGRAHAQLSAASAAASLAVCRAEERSARTGKRVDL
jgi:predicted dehydrogenase